MSLEDFFFDKKKEVDMLYGDIQHGVHRWGTQVHIQAIYFLEGEKNKLLTGLQCKVSAKLHPHDYTLFFQCTGDAQVQQRSI